MSALELFQRLGLALAIGFLTGVERGWKHRFDEDGNRVAGLRTFTLIGFLGGVSAALAAPLGAAAFAAMAVLFGVAWTAYKLWETWTDNDLSITGLIAGLLIFALGAYAVVGDMTVAAAGGVVVASVLAFKQGMHDWLKGLTWGELRSALLILAASAIAMPLLPDRALDPYGAFNPRELWKLTIVIAGASFAGYVALRALGEKAGPYVGAGIGALVSSTVVTLDLARRAKAGEVATLQAAAAAALASLVMFGRIGVLIAIFAAPALPMAIPAIIGAAGVSLLATIALGLVARRDNAASGGAELHSPLDLKDLAKFAAILVAITIVARLAAHFNGDAGLIAFAATAGLVDVDSVALAVGGLVRGGAAAQVGAEAILLAAAVNTLSKTVISATLGGTRFATAFGATSLLALAAGAAGFLLFNDLAVVSIK
jgi:uncharacterized membrane protein (DUF4010 family)